MRAGSPPFSSGVWSTLHCLISSMCSFSVTTLPAGRPVYRSVRHAGVPPRKPSAVVAAGLLASILALRLLNSARVMSLVQHFGAEPPFVQGTVQALFNG